MNKLIDFLDKLEHRNIFYRLNKVRDSILVEVAVPGQRWEVEFFRSGEIEIEKFISTGQIQNASELDTLFDLFSD